MPHKKRSHGHHKTAKEPKEHGKADACPVEVQHSTKSSALYPTAGSYYGKSQSSQTPPKPAAQVSTVKPAQSESASSGSGMATKPGVVTTTTGGSATVGAAGKETPKAKTETAPSSQDKVTPTVPPTAGTAAATSVTAPKESPKDTAKSTAASTAVKADAPKVDPAKTSKPAAAGTAAPGKVSVEGKKEEAKTAQTKVQAAVPSTAAKGAKEGPAVDPIDALANILPSTDCVRPDPVYTGPEVREHDITPEKAQKCGERDDTLPPGYRFENVGPAPADAKPAAVHKPISTDDALDSLSAGFTLPGPDKQKEHVESISASTTAHANFAPAPVKKAETPPTAAPPADKKAKMEKVSDDFSLDAGLPASSKKADSPVAAPPADKKAKMDKTTPDVSHKAGLDTKAGAKPKTEAGDSMSLDALSALGDTLPENVPKPESPKLKPKDIVSEGKVKEEKGVRVGERDDALPPEYRFKEENLKKLPPPKPEPKMDTDEALDILSGAFSTSSAASPVQAPVVCSSAAPAQKSPAPPADKKSKVAQASDLSLEAGLSAATAKKVQSAAAPPVAGPPAPSAEKKAEAHKPAAGKDTKPKTSQGDSMSLDALSALGDTLPANVPKPESPKLKPKDIVSEGKVKKEKGVFVGERDDTLPPEYRFKEEDLKKLPPPAPEPKLDTDEALDILSGDFSTSSAASPVQAPVVCSSAAPAQKSPAPPADKKSKVAQASDLSLEAGLSAATAKKVQSAAAPPVAGPPAPSAEKKAEAHKPAAGKDTKPKTSQGDSMSLDALSALGDTLPANVPKPESPKLKPKDIVSEGKVKKEKGVFVGERDDTLPPEYRFKEEDLKKLPPPAPEPKLDTDDALDILSGDFSTSSAASPVHAPVVCSSAAPAQAKIEDLSALDVLSRDTVASSKASGVQASVPPPSKKPPEKAVCPPEQLKKPEEKPQQTKPKIEKGDSMSLDALSALSDTLPADVPKPESPKLRPEDIVSEGKVKKEKGVLVGERDDTRPPGYRFKEEDLKKLPASKPEKMAEAKEKTPKEKAMDDKTALEMLSSDFSAAPKPAAPVTSSAATTKLQPPVLDSKPMAGPVLDSLSDTLVPEAIQAKSKTDKPKKHQTEEPPATDQVAAKPSSDVVPTSTKKGAKS